MIADPELQQHIQHLRGRIAQVFARREQLKQDLERGALGPRAGFQQLERTDRELSDLDTRFKALWDATHPAARWAERTTLEPMHLDCVTAIMLKILDGKCKMGAAERDALTAVYDVVRDRAGQGLDQVVHTHIATARQAQTPANAELIHAWRLKAEAHIPKPVMKGFKQLLRTSLPMGASPRKNAAP